MDDVLVRSDGEEGKESVLWKPSVELYCKNKPGWLKMEGTEMRKEMVGFAPGGGGPSES